MKAVIYARYSSEQQREESIEGQIRECSEYAEHSGLEIIGQYIDRAFSAKTDHRPDFQRMIKDSAKRQFDVVLVWKLDRFARNRYDSAYYKSVLKRNGVKVVSAKETIAEGSAGILLESMLEGYAEYYSAELSEKTRRGLKENALKCRVNGISMPLGYREDPHEHVFILDEAYVPIVREVFQLYLDGKSFKEISDGLAQKQIVMRDGRAITSNVIHTMLKNRKYIGEYKFGETVIPGGVPRIVSDEIFEQVQELMREHQKRAGHKKAIDEYLLTTKLFCGRCGAFMVGESGYSMTGKSYHYYRCVHTKKHPKTCTKKPVQKEWIEKLAIEQALSILYDDDTIEKLAGLIYEMQDEESPYLQALKVRVSDNEQTLKNVMKAIEAGIITPTTKQRMEELESEKENLQRELETEQRKNPRMTRDEILFGLMKYRELDLSTKEGKQKLIDGFINSIYLYDDRIVFSFNSKGKSRVLTLAETESSYSEKAVQPKKRYSNEYLFLRAPTSA